MSNFNLVDHLKEMKIGPYDIIALFFFVSIFFFYLLTELSGATEVQSINKNKWTLKSPYFSANYNITLISGFDQIYMIQGVQANSSSLLIYHTSSIQTVVIFIFSIQLLNT
ncbi:hypothetical protein SAMN05443529_12552 [Desulfosporosinus hippei DSM 8344]|uniref:Uncharacterized protein n=1 Tax=Desulfosporosinus hippei DSM 8344 TaxID=1121419 RepID=A0A1G8HHU4_9FIRM|nr:hypothetical protein SAMN05443529_12552 [Desulfosporosinus hippei DSM 8344]